MPDSLTNLWNVAWPYITYMVTIILSALVTYIFTERHFHRKKWQEAERQAEEDIKAGRMKTFKNVEELLEEMG